MVKVPVAYDIVNYVPVNPHWQGQNVSPPRVVSYEKANKRVVEFIY